MPPVRPNLVTKNGKKCFNFYENWHNKQLNHTNFKLKMFLNFHENWGWEYLNEAVYNNTQEI